ncbi:MAG: hypothetical protein ACLQK8_31425 [Streptosporangiaceae bacterium]
MRLDDRAADEDGGQVPAVLTGAVQVPSGLATPSMVVISWPSAWAASIRQERTGSPSSSTVQQPQTPCSQPSRVPVSPSVSRSRSAR